ncbi:single-strand DNA-binding protein [Oikeobacillus pervagus]|uniref:Single-stranded DNA-binding protein n=1 Tax=Oikeobacillus pervagus TaxID=1325931 RepID=A0AAJ1WFM4_9BACI|nr:single-stranded DNA-binding protein [Oikeobacillus pervagus]MDQ0214112.1 single-strand DNA-binding protein [Oikeobacillus pervagus]
MMNHVTLVGRLTKDPELRYTNDGRAFLNIIVAVNRHFRSKKSEGNDTDFILCTIWNKTAENTSKYCEKGSLVGIIGHLRTRSYENQEGRKVYVTEVLVNSIRFLSRKQQEEQEEVPLLEFP